MSTNKYIDIFNEYFIIDNIHLHILPAPCAIVEAVILQRVGYDKGKKKERLAEIQNALFAYGLELTTHKHFIDNIADYYPMCPPDVLQKLDQRCKYNLTQLNCYKYVSVKQMDLELLKSKLQTCLLAYSDLICGSQTLEEIYRIQRGLFELDIELFRTRQRLAVITVENRYDYRVDKKTGVVYSRLDKTVVVGSMIFVNLQTYLELVFPDANDIILEYAKLNSLFPVYRLKDFEERICPFQIVALDDLLSRYKNNKMEGLEEDGLLAYFQIIQDNITREYMLITNSELRIEMS